MSLKPSLIIVTGKYFFISSQYLPGTNPKTSTVLVVG